MHSFFSRERILLAAICLLGAGIGYAMRDERPADVTAQLNAAQELSRQALRKHQELIQQHRAGNLTHADLAEALERETLPEWRECVSLTEKCRAMGTKGDVFEELASHFTLRLSASESLIAALRQQDTQLAELAKQQWAEAEQVSARLNTRRKQALATSAPASSL